MVIDREELLKKCHQDYLELCFDELPLENVKDLISDKITGFGTNLNEVILSQNEYITLLEMQRKESVGLSMEYTFNTISKTLFSENNAALIIDDVRVKMTIENNKLELIIRVSTVFEFMKEKWWVLHFHGSLGHGVDGENDTFTVNEWKRKNEELESIIKKRTEELRLSLTNLKSTQAQLIQSEKMASLGELTAGIAHEIQNPLNFVNNFSEVSSELVHELKEELDKGDINEAKAISDDVIQNLEKIHHHGNRASSIVKGMLEHSRTSSGEKELTDINALADEYLRLSYHGLRAKNKDFNAEMVTNFGPDLPKIEVVSQDIGRVLLNLINNGFQAIDEQLKKGIEGYKPTLIISTSQELTANGQKQIAIAIKDNGPGIPEAIKDKIFQPFFTTKDTGKGTGLGLSLAYDIVKAHGGELTVESEEDKGSSFIITLTINPI